MSRSIGWPNKWVNPNSDAIGGTWRGSWKNRAGYTGSLTFRITNTGAKITGTIAATNVDSSFGKVPVPFTRASFDGQTFSFKAIGKDGYAAKGSLRVRGKQMSGKVWHYGRVTFELTKN